MQFFLDENVPRKAIQILRELGHEWQDIRGTDQEGLKDEEIFHLACQKKAVFITTDKDFFHTIHFNHKPHYGIIVIALSAPNTKNICDKLEWVLKQIRSENINNQCYLLSDHRCKIYS